MGSNFSDWAEATGAIYMGAGSAWPVIWFFVALVAFVVPLIVGFMNDAKANK